MPPPKDPTRYKLHIERLSASHKGQIAWNKGKKTGIIPESAFRKGHIPWHKGTRGLVKGFWLGKKNSHASQRMRMNPIMANPEAVTKMAQTKLRLFAEGKIRIWNKGLPSEQQPMYGKKNPNAAQTLKKLRQDPQFIEAMIKSFNKKPTRLERQLQSILDKHFPGEFAYNGNFDLGTSIGGLIPDFINVNGRKLVIEAFGDYWHSRKGVLWHQTEKGREVIYYKLGYRCIIIWEHELKDKEHIVEKILTESKAGR